MFYASDITHTLSYVASNASTASNQRHDLLSHAYIIEVMNAFSDAWLVTLGCWLGTSVGTMLMLS